MLSRTDLKKIARARLKDAEILYQARQYDGAIYLCGYAVEMALKARICYTLKWAGFPETGKEFDGYQSFKTHKLEILLHLSGAESRIKIRHLAEWSIVAVWNTEVRYRSIGSTSPQDAGNMIKSTKTILGVL